MEGHYEYRMCDATTILAWYIYTYLRAYQEIANAHMNN